MCSLFKSTKNLDVEKERVDVHFVKTLQSQRVPMFSKILRESWDIPACV